MTATLWEDILGKHPIAYLLLRVVASRYTNGLGQQIYQDSAILRNTVEAW